MRANRIRKSVGAENTFGRDIHDKAEMREALGPILDKVWRHCEATGTRGRTVTLKVKYADFHQITRRRSQPVAVTSRDALHGAALALIRSVLPTQKGIRLVLVTVSNFTEVQAEAADELPIFVEAAA